MPDLLLRGGRPWGFETPADVLVRDGAIERIEPGIAAADAEAIDVPGRLVLPGTRRCALPSRQDAPRRSVGAALGRGRARGSDRERAPAARRARHPERRSHRRAAGAHGGRRHVARAQPHRHRSRRRAARSRGGALRGAAARRAHRGRAGRVPSARAADKPGTAELLEQALGAGWRRSGASIPPASTATPCVTWTSYSTWPRATRRASTCTCTTVARSACGSWS